MTGADGKPMLVVGVEEDLLEAAQAVLKLMYEEVVPEGQTAVQLAKVGEGLQQSVPTHQHVKKAYVCHGVCN
jgi:hypothetical protein